MSFIITGLPRSRTAWLSAFLTGSGAYCLHEGLLRGEEGLATWLNESDLHGDSDSGLPLVWESLLTQLESLPKVVVVQRNPEEVIPSLKKYWSGIRFLREADPGMLVEILEPKLEELAKESSTLVVKYEKLSEIDTLREIWDFCLPTLPFDQTRSEILVNLNIQQCTKSFSPS
jgi:hypothetical protein